MRTTSPLPTLAALLGLVLTMQGAPAATYYSDPAAGSSAGDGSASAPWPRLQTVVTEGKLATLQGGDTLLLRSGNHGDVRLSGDNATAITLAAAPGQRPQLGRLVITRGANWRVKGLTISPSFAPAPYEGNIVTVAEGGPSRDLILEDCFIYTALDSTKWTAAEWIKTNSGVFFGRHGTHLTLRNNCILNTRFAVSLCAPDSMCEGNIITNFSGDGIRITRDGLTVQYNTVRNCFVGPGQGDDNHDDLMQCFLFNKGTGTVRNATIRGNVLIGFEDASHPLKHEPQAIGFFDGPLVDFLVEKNVILTNHYHGISLYDAVNCKILDNVVKPISDHTFFCCGHMGTHILRPCRLYCFPTASKKWPTSPAWSGVTSPSSAPVPTGSPTSTSSAARTAATAPNTSPGTKWPPSRKTSPPTSGSCPSSMSTSRESPPDQPKPGEIHKGRHTL